MDDKILVVDDVEDVRLLIREIMESNGYAVVDAKDGKTAIDILRKDKDIKLILLDIMMPEMDGLETAHEIRKFLPDIPIIVVSVKDDPTTKGMAKKLYGVEYYITKPFPNKKLVSSVEKALDMG